MEAYLRTFEDLLENWFATSSHSVHSDGTAYLSFNHNIESGWLEMLDLFCWLLRFSVDFFETC